MFEAVELSPPKDIAAVRTLLVVDESFTDGKHCVRTLAPPTERGAERELRRPHRCAATDCLTAGSSARCLIQR